MSADNTVELNIKTNAETKGFDEINEKLKAMKARTDAMLDDAREITGSTNQQAPDAGNPVVDPEIKDQMSQMLRIQYAGIARDIGQGISSIAKALHDTAQASAVADPALSETLKNTAVGLDSLSLGLSSAAQGFAVGGPMGAAIGGMVGLMAGPLKSAFNDYQDALIKLGESQKAMEESTQRLKRIQAELAVEMKQQRLDEHYRRELDAIEDVISAIERRAKVEASQRSAATATREAAQNEANRDPKMTFAQRTVADTSGDFNDAQAAIVAELQKAIDNAAALNEKASDLAANASGVAGISGEGSKEHLAAQEQVQEAEQAAENALADVEAATAIAEAKLAEIAAGIGTRLGDAAEQVQKQAADEAEKLLEAVTSSGAELNSTQQLAKQNLEKILKDGMVTANEQVGMQQALAALIGGWKTDTQTMLQAIAEANKISSTITSGLSSIIEEQNRIKQQVNQLSSR